MEVDMRSTRVLSLSLSADLLRAAERVAKQESRTRSDLFREALRRYIEERRWAELRRYGARRARKLGLTEPDVGRLIEAYRKGR